MEVILVTYVYPNALPFLPYFIKEVNKQNYKEFRIILFNDGVLNLSSYLGGVDYEFEIIEINNKSIAGVRFISLSLLKEIKCEYIIFQDIDDGMSENRIGCLVEKLATYSVVCNDLSIGINDKIREKNIWSERLGKNFIFDSSFLIDKNIIGLGNTGIQRKILSRKLLENEGVIAVDWFIFYQILYVLEEVALFTSDCFTIYNQHENNLAGISDKITRRKINRCIEVKKKHYDGLLELNSALVNELEKLVHYEKGLKYIYDQKLKYFPFWWEETNII